MGKNIIYKREMLAIEGNKIKCSKNNGSRNSGRSFLRDDCAIGLREVGVWQ